MGADSIWHATVRSPRQLPSRRMPMRLGVTAYLRMLRIPPIAEVVLGPDRIGPRTLMNYFRCRYMCTFREQSGFEDVFGYKCSKRRKKKMR